MLVLDRPEVLEPLDMIPADIQVLEGVHVLQERELRQLVLMKVKDPQLLIREDIE